MNHDGLVPLWKPLFAVLAGAMAATETESYRPIYPKQLANCAVHAWPAPRSQLARLVSLLQEPGAMTYLEEHIRQTLTAQMVEELRRMPYERFLGTQYWWIVRAMLLVRRGAVCEDCRVQHVVLDVHHLNYLHRGSEVFHGEDLMLLCRACHFARHPE